MAMAGDFEVIGHGCNCFCNMGAGIAKSISKQWPEVKTVDYTWSPGDKRKLGKYTGFIVDENLHILNLYTQYKFGRGQRHADYDAIRSCMKEIKRDFSGKRIGLPLIGCGLAGGDWSVVSKIIDEELGDEDVTIVVL